MMPSSNRARSDGARLIRLISDVGTATMRKYFDSKVPPANLTAELTNHQAKLKHLHAKKVIRDEQMNLLFPPTGMPPTTSKNYDITLLFVLIRNICGVTPPASTVWNTEPLSSDTSEVADLIRIKNYRNEIFHRKSTEVDHREFLTYWNKISEVLVRRGANAEDIAKLKKGPIDEDHYVSLMTEARDNTRIIMALQFSILAVVLFSILAVFCFVYFLPTYSYKEDYPMSQNFSNPGFVGREWVFQRMEEEILNTNDIRGVLLVADPGWGKSAIIKRLISSSSSSPVIHENIIGYHFCKYNEKSTRDGERFVKKLVQLISKKVPKYKEIIGKDQLIKEKLTSNCNDNPVECFQTAIVEPLQNLDSTGRVTSFILIDALDECLEKEESHQSIIVKILYKKVPDLPNWVKLLVTSRNNPLTIDKMSKIKLSNLTINVEDERNEQDLLAYAQKTLLQNFVNETSSYTNAQHLIHHALKFSKGNFLFLRTIIKNWQKYADKMNAESIPESLEDVYATSFTERFKDSDLDRFKPFLEILLATYSPLTLFQLEKILDYHFQDYNTREVANSLSEYFKTGIDQGPLEFHHQFFAEWLIDQTEGFNGINIQKSRGHRYIADYLLNFHNEIQTNLTFKELSEVCAHFLHGKKTSESNLRRLRSLAVSEVRDSWKRCILHDLAPKPDATKLLAEFIQQFNSVDILDFWERTPAMYAVEAGRYENMKLFVDNGANVNHTAKRKYYFCTVNNFVTGQDLDVTMYYNLNFLAACKGYAKIATALVESGSNVENVDECGWKALRLAAMIGRYEIVRLYVNHGAQPDGISLHHAAARNHKEIVWLLLDAGVRDECLPCELEDMEWCSMNLDRFHLCICETALYAAVSRNNLEMAKLILQYGNNSVNCRHGSGRTALMEAFSQKNIQMVELLINAGADINAECKSPLTHMVYDCSLKKYKNMMDQLLYIRYCKQPVCDGNRVIDFSFAYGLWKVMTPFISNGKFDTFSNNIKWNLATVAVIYDQVDFINATYGYRTKSIPNIETVLRYVAVCHSVKTLEHLLYSEDVNKFTTVYEDGKTLLHFAILGSVKSQTKVYITQSCPSSFCICPKITHADIAHEKRLETVMLLTKVLTSDINKQDKYGRTALHYATVQVLPEIVKYLVNVGVDWMEQDKGGNTALEYALRERPYLYNQTFQPCQLTSDRVFEVCQSTVFDGLTSFLLRMETITKCGLRAKNLLAGLLHHRLPLSLYSLFKSGLDVNCAHEHFIRHLNQTVFNGGSRERDDLLEIFKIFQINVKVVCDAPFGQSVLHLMSYIGKPFQVGNLFKPSVNKDIFPLQRFIANHSKGVGILNECYDKEGYLAIHRAVQGGNIHAVFWFKEIGVDITKKTKSGLTILVLATVRAFHNEAISSHFPENDILKHILKITKEKSHAHAFFQCNNTDISPLHVAASHGGIKSLQHIAGVMPELPFTCTNSDGILPIYLVYLYHWTDIYILYLLDRQALLDLGVSPKSKRLLKYPRREVEYHLIYNLFYNTPQQNLKNVLNNDGFNKCPGINDLLPNKTELQEYIKLCSRRCWPSAFEASRAFSSNFMYLDIQNNISNPFTDKFMDIAAHIAELRFHLVKTFPFFSMSLEKNLWQKVTRAQSCAFRCSCFEIMKLLQEKFTSQPLTGWNSGFYYPRYASSFLIDRMGWIGTSRDSDVKYRWPFRFLLKKALKRDKAYSYLQILNPNRK